MQQNDPRPQWLEVTEAYCFECIHSDPDCESDYCIHPQAQALGIYAESCHSAGATVNALDCPGFEPIGALEDFDE